MVKAWVDRQYEEGRVTVLTDEELLEVVEESQKRLGYRLQDEARICKVSVSG
ncbi:MAG: hypothetical protein HFG86_06550 [Dorea sp.]|nr:hypothetical protein [Dorea sp.]